MFKEQVQKDVRFTNKMEKHIFKINCEDTINRLNRLDDILNEFLENHNDKYSRLTDIERKAVEELSKIVKEKWRDCESYNKDLREFFSTKLNRYWKLIETIKNGSFNYEHIYYVYPYSINDVTNCIFALKTSDINQDFEFRFSDGSLLFDSFLGNDVTIEMEEVTREDFEDIISTQTKKIIDRRLLKLSKDYKQPKYKAVWVDDDKK